MNYKTYFGIFVITSAMFGGMILSSCSHDENLYSTDKVEQLANEHYAASFQRTFGMVGSDVDWGFSSKHSNARAITRAYGDYDDYKGDLHHNISFPDDLGADSFTIPGGTQSMPDQQQVGPGPWYIDENTSQVDSWSSECVIYVKGNVDMTNKTFSVNTGTKIYLTEKSTLKLGAFAAEGVNIAFYIAKDAKLETTGHLKVQTYPVYNHGTIKVGSYELCSGSLLYNVGKLETTGDVKIDNSTCYIVNDGDIKSGSVHVEGQGSLQNNAEWTVNDSTIINCNNGGWVNNGHWTTLNFAYTGGSDNVINNCFLEVTNDFEMNTSSVQGAFKIDTGGGVLTQNFYGGRDSSTGAVSGPFKIVMNPDAVFVVAETAQFESGRGSLEDDYAYGIFGPSSGGYAVFQAKKIVRDSHLANTWGAVTYGGNLYVSAEEHFAQGNDGRPDYKFIIEQDGFSIADNIYAEGFNEGKPDINIPETPCSPGFKGKALYRVIAEDLSASEASDFDFNDVVFDVVKAENGRTTLKLICAGGVLPLRVRGANELVGVEIHSVFGQTVPDEKGVYQMFNTGAGPTVPEATFTVEGEYTTPEQIKDIIIEVEKNHIWMPLPAKRGEAACKILVDDTFKPVREKRNIADENQKFTNYVQGSFHDDFWWK